MLTTIAMSTPFLFGEDDAPAKRRILEQALRLFSTKGLCETGIRDIARATGYTNPALYKHFAGKDELALRLFIACYGELHRRLEAAVAGTEGFEPRCRAFVTAFLDTTTEHPQAVAYANEQLHRFWPQVPPAMKRRTIVTLARRLAREAPCTVDAGRRTSEEMRIAAATGVLTQVARLVFLGGIKGPPTRYVDDATLLLQRIFCS
jgi:TetR/AcrR family transcriptional regulator, repressor of fatR-cypB operon